MLLLFTLGYAALAVLAAVWMLLAGHDGALRTPASPVHLWNGLLVGLGIVAACHLAHRWIPAVRRASDVLANLFGPLTAVQAIYLAAISGFAEEAFFRGALWPHLGLVGTSVLFGLLHTFPARQLALYPVFAFFTGLVLGGLREASGSVWPPIVAHFAVNAINLTSLGRMRRLKEAPVPRPAPVPVAAGAAVGGGPSATILPHDFGPADSFPVTVWHYRLQVELRGTDRQNLPDCLEAENLELFHYVDRDEVYRQLRGGEFVFSETFREPLGGFAHDIAAISAYLFDTVAGAEIAERFVDESTSDDVRGWKVVAQRGEWVKVPLVVTEPDPGRFVVDMEREDLEILAARWEEYPRWFQDGMRFKYPSLRTL